MNVVIEKSELKGEITAIPSKSYAHRILICSAFANNPTIIYNLPTSQDILATKQCLKVLGARFEEENGTCKVIPATIKQNSCILNANESGSTLRFMLPIVSALGGEYIIKGTEKLISRPNLPLLNTLKNNGIEYEIGKDYVKITGKLTSGNFIIDASLSSQYLTGLMLACPLLNFTSKIVCEKLSSSDYIEITKDVLGQFGIELDNKNGFVVKGKYCSPNDITVEGDYSNVLFFAVGGVLNGDVTIKGLKQNSKQGDRKAFDILKAFSAKISGQSELNFKKSNLIGTNFFADDIPDAMPALSLVMASAENSSTANGVDRLKIKESDRLSAIINLLTQTGVKCEYDNNKLYVYNGSFSSGVYDGCNDHRIVMTLAIMGSVCGLEIVGAEAVNKSYPTFFEDFKKLGGKFWIK